MPPVQPIPAVSMIIVNWNGEDLLRSCLDSVLRQTVPFTEIILVDNASSDGSVRFVAHNYPEVIIMELDRNRGFTGGNIAGLERASGDFIALLNTDAELSDRWLETMLTGMAEDRSIGSCSSKIIIKGTSMIDSAGDRFTTAFNGTKIGEYDDESLYDKRRYVHGACAAAVFYRRQMLEDIGFFDDEFFFNHEDTDLNFRAWLSGWKCLFVPNAVVYHAVNASIGHMADKGVYYFSRNTEWVWIKNAPFLLMVLYLPQKIIYEFVSFGYFGIMSRKLRPFLRGKWDALKGIGSILKKRKAIQLRRKLSSRTIAADLMPISRYILARIRNLRKRGKQSAVRSSASLSERS